MYLRVPYYCDACLNSGALRVGVKTLQCLHNTHMSTGSTISGTIYFQDASLDILVHTTFM